MLPSLTALYHCNNGAHDVRDEWENSFMDIYILVYGNCNKYLSQSVIFHWICMNEYTKATCIAMNQYQRCLDIVSFLHGTFSSNVWNWNFKLSKNQLNHSKLFYLCAERRTSRECVSVMAARHRYLFLRYALLNQTTLNMQNNRYVTWYTFTFPLIP